MTAFPMGGVPVRRRATAWAWLSTQPEVACDSVARSVLLLDRFLAFAVLTLMLVAALVIAAVTLGVLMGFIA